MKKFTVRTLAIIAGAAFITIPVAGIAGHTDTLISAFTLFFMSGFSACAVAT